MSSPERLTVVLYGSVIGTVQRATRFAEPTFTYDEAYLQAGTVPLSIRMPLRAEAYGPGFLNPFLDGLLPENRETRQQWAARLGTDSEDSFNLLSRMGWDCAGAAQFCPPDELDQMRSREGLAEPLTEAQIAQRLRSLRDDAASWSLPDEHWSLPGQQEKFTLTKIDGSWHQAKGATPTTHIVKPGIGRMHHQDLVEHVTMLAGAKVGVSMAHTEFLRFEDQTAIVVERFDRIPLPDGTITRLHQEDFCQATGFLPARKYEAPNGPGVRAFTKIIDKHSTDARADRRALGDFVAINYVAGAPDGHSKNLSLALLPGSTTIAPVYDLATSFPYDGAANGKLRQVAVSIGGRRKFGQVLAKHWDESARQIGLTPDMFKDRVIDMATDFPDAWATALTETDAPEAAEILERSKARLASHCNDILSHFSGTTKRATGPRTRPPTPPTPPAGTGLERPPAPQEAEATAAKATRRVLHVTPNPTRGWTVVDPKDGRTAVVARTQQEAITRAREILMGTGGGELTILKKDGHIRTSSRVRAPSNATTT